MIFFQGGACHCQGPPSTLHIPLEVGFHPLSLEVDPLNPSLGFGGAL